LHSDEFKANAVAAVTQPGVSMAAVAMSLGINANLLRRGVRDVESKPVKVEGNAVRTAAGAAPVAVCVHGRAVARAGRIGERHPPGVAPRCHDGGCDVACSLGRGVRGLDAPLW
jgi:hypothetical protein